MDMLKWEEIILINKPQGREAQFPTVVPAVHFDPEKDASWIDTAIKTKGKRRSLLLFSLHRMFQAFIDWNEWNNFSFP